MTRKRRDERGATAVLVAVLAVSLFIAGAIAMDMGSVYAKRSALQSNVDMAVLAAAAEIDGTNTCTNEAIAAATDYLTRPENEVDGQATVDLGGSEEDGDGFIQCIGWRVELTAPEAHAEFTMGKVAGVDGVDVPAFAAAEIKSPSQHFSLPMYAVSGCDYGQQQISDPPPGGGANNVPNDLEPDSEQHNNAIFTISPTEVAADVLAAVLTLQGNNLENTVKVTFTNTTGGYWESTTWDTISANSIVGVAVPQGVLNAGGIW